jgi:hypothetical protein
VVIAGHAADCRGHGLEASIQWRRDFNTVWIEAVTFRRLPSRSAPVFRRAPHSVFHAGRSRS